jgi:hypothetical protein
MLRKTAVVPEKVRRKTREVASPHPLPTAENFPCFPPLFACAQPHFRTTFHYLRFPDRHSAKIMLLQLQNFSQIHGRISFKIVQMKLKMLQIYGRLIGETSQFVFIVLSPFRSQLAKINVPTLTNLPPILPFLCVSMSPAVSLRAGKEIVLRPYLFTQHLARRT